MSQLFCEAESNYANSSNLVQTIILQKFFSF